MSKSKNLLACLWFLSSVAGASAQELVTLATRLSDKYPLITVAGGSPPQFGPCDSLSAHGFLGKESETVEQIVNWMLKKPYQQEVK